MVKPYVKVSFSVVSSDSETMSWLVDRAFSSAVFGSSRVRLASDRLSFAVSLRQTYFAVRVSMSNVKQFI